MPSPTLEKQHPRCIVLLRRPLGRGCPITNSTQHYERKFKTPTYASNKEIWNIADIEEEDVLEPTVTALKEVTKLGILVEAWMATTPHRL